MVAVHEALLSVVPGAQYAPDITMDRAEIFEALAAKLTDFREHGGQTIVDSTGMFHGRDLKLYEALSRSTGVHIVASTGMGPEEDLGGYFLTPQTNPPTPWPAEKFADLFGKEVTEGMVVPARRAPRRRRHRDHHRRPRRHDPDRGKPVPRLPPAPPLNTGVPVSIRFGADVLHDLDIVLDEQLPADRVLVGGLDRKDAAGAALEVAGRGAFVGLDHVGLNDDADYLTDHERAELVLELVKAGHAGQDHPFGQLDRRGQGPAGVQPALQPRPVHVRALPQGPGPERRRRPAHPRGQPAQPADRALSTRRPTPNKLSNP